MKDRDTNKKEADQMITFEQLSNNGSETINGIEYRYINQPSVNDDGAQYQGHVLDPFGNEFIITFDVLKDELGNLIVYEDEQEACDWENPVAMELIDADTWFIQLMDTFESIGADDEKLFLSKVRLSEKQEEPSFYLITMGEAFSGEGDNVKNLHGYKDKRNDLPYHFATYEDAFEIACENGILINEEDENND